MCRPLTASRDNCYERWLSQRFASSLGMLAGLQGGSLFLAANLWALASLYGGVVRFLHLI